MHEMSGKLYGNISFTAQGSPIVTIKLNERFSALKMVEELAGKDISIKVGRFKQKRSLDANAYCWMLIGKLAEKLNIPRTDIYRAAIKEIGGNSDTVCVQDKAVQSLCDGWQRNGIGWQTDTFPSKIDGCTNVILYYGSSTYDSKQMTRLVNFIVDECIQQNIEVKPAEEVASLLLSWWNK